MLLLHIPAAAADALFTFLGLPERKNTSFIF
jgi:hypothetical protein